MIEYQIVVEYLKS